MFFSTESCCVSEISPKSRSRSKGHGMKLRHMQNISSSQIQKLMKRIDFRQCFNNKRGKQTNAALNLAMGKWKKMEEKEVESGARLVDLDDECVDFCIYGSQREL